MTDSPYIAEAAALIGDPARANMLLALMAGRPLSATELGLAARVAPSTASGHLARLIEGRLVTVSASGRHRYYSLASGNVARALETLMSLAVEGPARHRPRSSFDTALARARTCYDHLAGKLGVAIADSLVERKFITLGSGADEVTELGLVFFSSIGLMSIPYPASRRPLCRGCLDWSERRWHVAGALGAAIAQSCFERGWTERRSEGRSIAITQAGEEAFERLFSVRV